MKNFFLSIVLLIALVFTAFAGDKSPLAWKSFDAGLAEAKKANKKVLVDVYTDWCKWCKVMDVNTYSDEKVVEYLGKQFVVVRMNAESSERVTYMGKKSTAMQLAGTFGVDGYPATVFLEPDGEMITRVPGYVTADRFAPILKFIGESAYKKMTWDEYQKTLTPAKED